MIHRQIIKKFVYKNMFNFTIHIEIHFNPVFYMSNNKKY